MNDIEEAKHISFMQRALVLAERGSGAVAPNPMVGAVLVCENRIIGEGWHQAYGGPHAEVNCINSVAQEDRGKIPMSTLYVSLEPCAHFGKTPPCAHLIIEHKISEVVVACVDPFAAVAGKGIALLEEAGIKVKLGVCEQEAQELNRRFFVFHQKKRPFIILKWAQSKDGFIAPLNGQKVMLSNALVQRYVHKMRYDEAAIMVGYRTALMDDPHLNNRLWWKGKQPLRVLWDRDNSLPEQLHLKIDGAGTWIYNTALDSENGALKFKKIEKVIAPLKRILADLYQEGIQSLIVEGGSSLLEAFIKDGLWDEAHVIHTPQKIGFGIKIPKLAISNIKEVIGLGDNQLFIIKS